MSAVLRCRDDGTFTIVQFTDLHWQNGEPEDLRTRELMERVLEAERPDFVVFTGDLIYGGGCADPRESLRAAAAPAAESGLPWAAVLGNHDGEGAVSRPELMKTLAELPGNANGPGAEGVDGVGNAVLCVEDTAGTAAAALYFLDTGSYSPVPEIGGYDWIRRSQIDWFLAQSRTLNERNGGRPLPSLVFFHIPLPEYEQVWKSQTCYGRRQEIPGYPRVNSGFFSAMLEAGGVMGTFCGHDHLNDYWGELGGIRLGYGRATGYHTYGRKTFPRGARVIRLRQGEPGFETWVRLDNGETIREPLAHRPAAAGRS
ncbi:metallophosphoesterase family protein [Cohnella caldifontis]|uniref:metallophosphoesterase family protein n=1 Tax=Cohnella caldifontis TaxID=3027471 RepID=UPI0023ECCDA9|nr:metallophosphoesterase family protein [Cohnella sp. YIM B05605]